MSSGATVSSKQGRYLAVRVGTSVFGIPQERIRRIVRSMVIHPLPGSPRNVIGLGQIGAEPILVLDLGSSVDEETFATGQHPIVVVVEAGPEGDTETVGLAVDEAIQLVRAGDGEAPIRLAGRNLRPLDLTAIGAGA